MDYNPSADPSLANPPPIQKDNAIHDVSQAYSLGSQIGQYQDQQKERVDQDIIQKALKSGYSMSTPDQVDKLTEDLKGKVTPKTYEGLIKYKSELENSLAIAADNAMKLDENKINDIIQKQELWSKSTRPVVDQYMSQKEKLDAMPEGPQKQEAMQKLTAQYQSGIQAVAGQFSQPDAMGHPMMDPKAVQALLAKSPEETKALLESSDYYNKWLSGVAERKLKEAHAQFFESGGSGKVGMVSKVDEMVYSGEITPEEGVKMKEKLMTSGGSGQNASFLTPEAVNVAANRILSGDKTSLSHLSRADAGAVNNRLAEIAAGAAPNVARRIIQAQSDLAGAMAGQRSLGTRSANIDSAAYETSYFAQNLAGVIDNVTREGVVPVNTILRNVAKGGGSPDEARFATYWQALVGSYAVVIGRGRSTVESRKEAQEALLKDYTPEQWRAVLDAIVEKEVPAVIQSTESARGDIQQSINPTETPQVNKGPISGKGEFHGLSTGGPAPMSNSDLLKAVKDGTLSPEKAKAELQRRKAQMSAPQTGGQAVQTTPVQRPQLQVAPVGAAPQQPAGVVPQAPAPGMPQSQAVVPQPAVLSPLQGAPQTPSQPPKTHPYGPYTSTQQVDESVARGEMSSADGDRIKQQMLPPTNRVETPTLAQPLQKSGDIRTYYQTNPIPQEPLEFLAIQRALAKGDKGKIKKINDQFKAKYGRMPYREEVDRTITAIEQASQEFERDQGRKPSTKELADYLRQTRISPK